MKKAIFIDIDGTLRNDEKEISERTLSSIKKVKELGNEIILCTGRPCDYVQKLSDIVKECQFIIYNNGAGIYDCEKNKIIYENPMETERILDLYSFANIPGVRFILACHGTRYVNKIRYYDGTETLYDLPIDKFLNNNKVISVTIASENFDLIKDMKNQINAVKNVKIINQHKSLINSKFPKNGTIYYDIVEINSSKGNAIKYFCDKFNISKENRIAIGDSINDISMFEACNIKVAMGNALFELKEKANYITDDNNHDGVAKFLEQYFF